jgi:hypothetical protein
MKKQLASILKMMFVFAILLVKNATAAEKQSPDIHLFKSKGKTIEFDLVDINSTFKDVNNEVEHRILIIIYKGISVISTDFKELGTKIAKFVENDEPMQYYVLTNLILIESL